ncbi:hypothetical protein DFH05DRAFT_1525559 [Lentinula detonsa]|uniref:Uncharacterized protein n=2 Tax=Lentinula TaxID=5352 RepID=A0AA38NNV1_9AGAR|nr:hypothetical protein DFH05DRAFT_1525559 [Lentinula detonsa]KAJ3781565.1 hypothetical protein GGU10DRAFT_411423 [Lentinula aff. detonsa]
MRVANDASMEPVISVDKISQQRWKLKCSICDIPLIRNRSDTYSAFIFLPFASPALPLGSSQRLSIHFSPHLHIHNQEDADRFSHFEVQQWLITNNPTILTIPNNSRTPTGTTIPPRLN